MQNQKQTTKPANVAKAAQKAAPKANPKAQETKATKAQETAPKAEAKTAFYPALLAACLAGKFGAMAKAYYHRAGTYHKKAGTVFPRQRNAGTIDAMLSEGRAKAEAKAPEIIGKAAKGILPAGDAEGQAVYDLMMSGRDLPAA